MPFEIGFVEGSCPDVLTEGIKQSLSQITGEEIKEQNFFALAGPNYIVEIIGSPEDWVVVAKAVIGIYGVKFVEEAASQGWKDRVNIYKNLKVKLNTPLQNLFKRIDLANERKIRTFLAVPTGGRNTAIDVTGCSHEEMSMIIVLMSKYSEEIQNYVNRCKDEGISDKLKVVEREDGCYQIIEIQVDEFGGLRVSGM